ncbi:MAG: YraN family protein [Actinomycetaceae bacterium]|nr:YraN family protein [Actinomycetaceae bacterium]
MSVTNISVPPLAPNATNKELGDWGEELAVRLLESGSYTILDRNWRSRHGELDLVALAPARTTLVAVEVKTRRVGGHVGATEAISRAKLARLRRLLGQWVDDKTLHPERLRLDLLAITVDALGAWNFQHIRGIS